MSILAVKRHKSTFHFIALYVYAMVCPNLVYAQISDPAAIKIVSDLSFADYKRDIETLAGFGDRSQGSESFDNSANWIENRLREAGYEVEHHEFKYFLFFSRHSIYVTKVGAVSPDSMYIVSAHLDGTGDGGAADDDASGSALVLEAALALAPENIKTENSIRFIFWNNEETGADGSWNYVAERARLQGVEEPVGSGRYPEPFWLGMIQHDMLLFDHGLPVQPQQITDADIDIEYQADSEFANESKALATQFQLGNKVYSTDYPAEIGSNMSNTDSWRFENVTASISIRENQRIDEIGEGSNPHYHEPTDVPGTYSEADYRLGFNALQMTLGTVASLAGISISPIEKNTERK